jgi:hypothetical protein
MRSESETNLKGGEECCFGPHVESWNDGCFTGGLVPLVFPLMHLTEMNLVGCGGKMEQEENIQGWRGRQ